MVSGPLGESSADLTAQHWGILIAATVAVVLVLLLNVAHRNALRWRALSDIRLDVVADDFFALGDLSKVRQALSTALHGCKPAAGLHFLLFVFKIFLTCTIHILSFADCQGAYT
jgi:hypothetical protein